MNFRKILSVLSLILTVMLLLCSCGIREKTVAVSSETVAMGSVLSVTSYTYDEASGKQLNSEIFSKIYQLDSLISKNSEDAALYKLNLNADKVQTIDKELFKYISETVNVFSDSQGKLSASSGALTELWGIDTDNFKVPSDNEIKNALPLCNDGDLELDGENYTVKLADGQKINLGAVGKGIACDKAVEWWMLSSQASKGLVISVGGSVAVSGVRDDGKPWNVGIRNPFGSQNEYFAKLKISDNISFISTSGSYEKRFEENGKVYHHILDLTTGCPVETDLVSVTVKADSGFLSDALSTMCFALGEAQALPLLEKYNAEAVFVYFDKTVFATDGIIGSLEITDGEFVLK